MKKSTNQNSKVSEKTIEDEIERALSLMPMIKNRALKWLYDGIPLAVVASTTISVFAGWYTGSGVDLLYLTGGLTVVASALFTRSLFEQYPQILLLIWRRKILCVKQEKAMLSLTKLSPRATEKVFLELIKTAQEGMNNILGMVGGVIGTIVVGWMIWLLDQGMLQDTYLHLRNPFSIYGTILLMRLAFLVAGFVGGAIGWRIIVIADTISRLGRTFDFDLQINHPDECGGLRPIGDLCLKLAYVISPLPLLLGSWLVFINFFDIRFLHMATENIEPLSSTIVFLTIPVAALCLFSFFVPLGSIHTAMLRAQSRLQVELDSISQEIHQLSTSLLTEANSLVPQRGTSLEEKIEFLKRVYARNSQIPTWPYKNAHLWGLLSTQVVPSLGVISSVIGFIRGFGK